MRFLLTTQASNDLGRLTRTLPIADELRRLGHAVAFCNPAQAPRHLIAEAGFPNLIPAHPAYYLNHLIFTSEPDLGALWRLITSRQVQREFGRPLVFLRQVFQARPRIGGAMAEVWSVDHLAALHSVACLAAQVTHRPLCSGRIQTATSNRGWRRFGRTGLRAPATDRA